MRPLSAPDQPRPRRSLRRTLLQVLLPGLALVLAGELWLTWRNAVVAADAAYDRSLYGAIKSIDANISTASGGLGVELPYRMLEFFELTASGRVYYRVATEDGLVQIGNADLPAPRQPLVSGRPAFADARYYDEDVRLGSYARPLDRVLTGDDSPQRVVIQVAETLESRAQFTRSLLLQALSRDLVLVGAAAALFIGAVLWALRPLRRLRHELQARAPDDLTPMVSASVPSEVRPLVDAINHHVARYREAGERRRRFIDDASHQLRTPLTTLATQLGFVLRENDPALAREALQAVKAQLDEAIRQTNQMLALAHADSAELAPEPLDLGALAEATTRRWWPEARRRGLTLAYDAPAAPVWVDGQGSLLTEALANLLHNAIRYTPAGGSVTVGVLARPPSAQLTVEDSGPGIPAAEQPRAGDRFFRASNASQPGTGLGLAIVRSIAERHHGRFVVGTPASGRGLRAELRLPWRAPPTSGLS